MYHAFGTIKYYMYYNTKCSKKDTILCFQPITSKNFFHFLNSWLLMLLQIYFFNFQTQRHHYQPLFHFLQTQCLHGSCLLRDSCENHNMWNHILIIYKTIHNSMTFLTTTSTKSKFQLF